MTSTLILGASGLLGPHLLHAAARLGSVTGLARSAGPAGFDWLAADVADDPVSTLAGRQPRLIVFNSALSNAEQCERDPVRSRRTNAEAPARWAAHAARNGTRFVFVSTDLVFDGTRAPYREDAAASPLSTYGRDKLAGERAVLAAHPGALVVRPPLLLGLHADRGIVLPLLRALRERRPVSLFTDEMRAPLPCEVAAGAIVGLGLRAIGLLHLCGATTLSRYELGLRIAACAGLDASALRPCLRSDLNLQPPRPGDLTLDCSRAQGLGFEPGDLDEQIATLVRGSGSCGSGC